MDSGAGSDEGHAYALPINARILEFEVVGLLGHDGLGIVYAARDTLLNEDVVVREYLPADLAVRKPQAAVAPKSAVDRGDFASGLKAFLEEARLIARIRHPNVIRVRRFFELNGTGYIVQDYEDGVTLSERLRQGPLPEAELRRILAGVLDGLEEVHERAILHRDLKPGNIMLRRDGTPVLIDFGAARDFGTRHSRSVTAVATPGYAPPEQFGVGGQQGPWSDLYAVGAVLYQCVTGAAPVDSLRRLRKDPLVPATTAAQGRYDPSLLSMIDWLLRIEEAERPASVAAVRAGLSGNPVPQRAPAPAAAKTVSATITAVSLKPVRPGHVLLELDASVQADVLELAFFVGPPGRYLSPSLDGKPSWRSQPHYFELYRTGEPGRASFAIGPQIVNAVPAQSQVTLSSADGFIRGSAAWPGVPGAAVAATASPAPRRRRWIAIAAAALVLLVLAAAGIGGYVLHLQESARYAAAVDDVEALRAYVRDCRLCVQRGAAEARIAQIEEERRIARLTRALVDAGNDIAAVERVLAECGSNCPERLRTQAQTTLAALQKRQEQARQEEATYKAAQGNLAQLKQYVTACTVCAFIDDARRQIATLQRQQEEVAYKAARGTVLQLQAYIDGCTVCEFAPAAREEITYLTARGNIFQLNVYLSSCKICEFRSNAQTEIEIASAPKPDPVTTRCSNLSGNPISGSINLGEFFSPDPSRHRVVAGGSQDLSRCDSNWRGWVSGSPDLRLTYRTAGNQTLTISVQSGTDTVLLVRDPTGVWHFDDDSGEGMNGKVRIARAPNGRYDIWVGTYSAVRGKNPAATVLISEY